MENCNYINKPIFSSNLSTKLGTPQNDHQSIGMLFEQVSQQWLKPTIMQNFWKEFYQAIQNLSEIISTSV